MFWVQNQITLPAFSRGFHLITSAVVDALPDLEKIEIGLLHVFIHHTSASLTINENADPDVRVDMETAISHVAPEDLPFVHTIEGPDDMPAHVKSSLLGCSLSLPISGGRLGLGGPGERRREPIAHRWGEPLEGVGRPWHGQSVQKAPDTAVA